jgi:hypothetical protein
MDVERTYQEHEIFTKIEIKKSLLQYCIYMLKKIRNMGINKE